MVFCLQFSTAFPIKIWWNFISFQFHIFTIFSLYLWTFAMVFLWKSYTYGENFEWVLVCILYSVCSQTGFAENWYVQNIRIECFGCGFVLSFMHFCWVQHGIQHGILWWSHKFHHTFTRSLSVWGNVGKCLKVSEMSTYHLRRVTAIYIECHCSFLYYRFPIK